MSTQLQAALDSRIAIEQAKGILAERLATTTEEAFKRLRRYARSHNLLLANVAADLVAGTLPRGAMDEMRASRRRRPKS